MSQVGGPDIGIITATELAAHIARLGVGTSRIGSFRSALPALRDAGFAMLIIGGLSLHAAATAVLGVLSEAIHDGRAADYLAHSPHA